MIKYPNPQVLIVTSGKSRKVTLNNLSRNLKPSSEIYELSDKEVYLGLISHQTLVFFATEFADYALKNYAKRIIPEAEACIRLTRKWLEDRESVSDEELKAAADAAYAAAYAANAAYAAANAANAANAAAYAAANAAYAAADDAAAYAAADDAADDAAAYAADAAAGENKNQEYERQGTFILDFLKTGNHLFLV